MFPKKAGDVYTVPITRNTQVLKDSRLGWYL